jgi:phenylalanyl-tRNA synthetase beta chain
MKVPMRWLSEFVDTGLSARELAHKLTMAGLEAEKIIEIGSDWDKVFVGLVKNVERHPNADRLVLADIEAGELKLRVVTGAPNIQAGQKVALALAGARLIDGHSETLQYKTLKPGVIRGIPSEGMACSEKELGISDEHEGILVLSEDAPVGTPLRDWLGDTVIEFEITPNLVHAFSVHGIAREAAAIASKPLTLPPAVDLETLSKSDKSLVAIEAPDLCSRYMAIVIEGVKIGPSPDWLARRLIAAGLRPVNNVVDVTNYVMLETGQPLHAFDREYLHERRIVVRRANQGETMETLDHQRRELTPEMLVIADADRAVAIAGVMGGVDSEVSESTTTLLLEGANFDMKSVRHTRMALKLRTDASSRFERGLDPNLVGPAMARAIRLLLDLNPGSRATAVRDVYLTPVVSKTITMDFDRIERVLGTRYEPDVVLNILERLGFEVSLDDAGRLTILVPTFRRDVSIQEDIIEEVARIAGYENLPSTLPSGKLPEIKRDSMFRLKEAVRGVLTAAGLSEAVTYVTVSSHDLAPFDSENGCSGIIQSAPKSELLRVINPLQSDRNLLRPTLIPSLLATANENLKHSPTVSLFELARVYLPTERDQLPDEIELAGIVMTGRREPLSRYGSTGDLDYFDLAGGVEEVFARTGLKDVKIEQACHPGMHPGRTAAAFVGDRRVAVFGELNPNVADQWDLADHRVCVGEIDLRAVIELQPERVGEIIGPKFLPVEQDFAIVVDESTPAAEVESALRSGAGPLATRIVLFDIYRGPQIGEGKKSLAYRVTFTAPDRALTDAELTKVRSRIERVIAQQAGGSLRS